jgi:hypothetical protein
MADTATRPARVLIHDFDRSLSSLASDERIEEVFGFRPRRYIRTTTMTDVFLKTHKPVVLKNNDNLGAVEEEYYSTDPSIDVNVLDSVSAYAVQLRKEIMGENNVKKMSIQLWGEAGDSAENILLKLCRTNTTTIMIGHTKAEEDKEAGIIRRIPAVFGRLSDEIGRYFDCVFYTKALLDHEGKRSFLWQGIADQRCDAKCRYSEVVKYLELNGGYMPQDFKLLFSLMNQSGFPHGKILILGGIGTGKTYSLSTLKNVPFPVRQ